MSEGATEVVTDAGETAGTEVTAPTVESLTADVERWKALSRKNEANAKTNKSAVAELDKLRQTAMTDQERAVEAARIEGRTEATKAVASRLVDAEFKAAIAGRMTPEQTVALLSGLDRASFVDESGEVDTAKVTAFVDSIAPVRDETSSSVSGSVLDLGQGVRSVPAHALNGDPLLNALKGKLGIR